VSTAAGRDAVCETRTAAERSRPRIVQLIQDGEASLRELHAVGFWNGERGVLWRRVRVGHESLRMRTAADAQSMWPGS
jgi:hypothetical protein